MSVKIPPEGIVGQVALREAASGEFRQIMELVQAALVAKLGLQPEAAWQVCIEAIFSDRVILRRNGRFWSYTYTLTNDNQVALGDAQEVVENYVPVALREALAAAVFTEAKDATGSVWEAVLIRAGLSKNGTFYPDDVLREAVKQFDGARVLARSDEDHLKDKGKDARNVIGWISAPRFVEGAAADTGYVAGLLNLTAGANGLRETLVDAWQRGKRDLVGLSIDANGKAGFAMREARRVRVAKAITKVNSVDLIVEPSAGGGLVRLVEAADPKEQNDMTLRQKMLDTIKAKKPEAYAKINVDAVSDDELEAAYREAVAAPAPTATGLTAEQVSEQIRMVEARANARATINATNLPQAAKDRIWAQLEKRERFTEAEVTETIKSERDYLAKFVESGRVQLGDIEVEDRSVKVADMLDAFFDPKHKDHGRAHSFKECYIEITGDRLVTGRLDNCDRSRLAESVGAAFRESLDSTSFANVLGNTITRRLIADYREVGQYDVWRNACEVVPVSDFRTQERTRFGGYGDLPAVNQGSPYLALSSPTDEKATYAATKRGGTEDITLEMIKNDDVGVIRRIPVKMSRSAKRTLAKFVLDFVRTNPVIYDGVTFFHASHGNLGAAALDATSVAARRLAMLKQAELNSADRIGIGPKHLWVPFDAEEAAVNLFNRNTNNDKTFVNSLTLMVMPVWYWTDTNDWALSADPLDIPGIEIGFLDGNQEPEIFVQDNPTVGSMFSNDKITYKIRHIYGGNVKDYRGWDKSVAA